MNFLKITNSERKWYQIILWWEIRRIPYNLILRAVGLLSFYICYATIPHVYLIFGLGLNILYTLGWVIELLFINWGENEHVKLTYPKRSFLIILTLSITLVLGSSIFLLII